MSRNRVNIRYIAIGPLDSATVCRRLGSNTQENKKKGKIVMLPWRWRLGEIGREEASPVLSASGRRLNQVLQSMGTVSVASLMDHQALLTIKKV